MEAIIGGVVGLVVGAAATSMVSGFELGTGTMLRGVAKEVIKGGLIVQEAAAGMFSGGGNYFGDIVTEAKAELDSTPARETRPAKTGSRK